MNYTIIHAISAYGIFGAEKIVITESQILHKKGFKVIILDISPFVNSPFSKKVKQLDLPYYQLVSNSKLDLEAVFKLKDFLIREGCDLVHSNKYKADIISLMACRMAEIPIITTVHGWCSEDLKARAYELIQAFSWRFFDRVICVSESYKQKALQFGVCENKLKVIHNGIDVDGYMIKDAQDVRLSVLTKYGIPSHHFVAGIIGRLSIEKGHRYFVEAAKKLLKEEPNVSFVIIGDGPEENRIRKRIGYLGLNGHIRMLGYIEKPQEIYAGLDAVVMPSLREGLPNVLLEAMFYGKPVIATNVGGIPDVIRNNESGLLIPAKNSSAIVDTLITLIRHPEQKRRIGSAAKRRVLEQFSFGQRMAQIERLYQEVIQEHRK